MDMVKSVLREELSSSLENEKFYQDEINKLPKGSLWKKNVGSRSYFYLKHREGRKVKNDYIGRIPEDEEKVMQIREVISRRLRLENNLKEVRQKIKYLRKALNVRAN